MLLILFLTQIMFSQNIDMDSVKAEEEFSWGVRAYHNAFYNKAIINFEKALNYKPDNFLYKEWLGYAYFKSGFDEAALNVWETLIQSNEASAVLVETVKLFKHKKIEEYDPENIRYIEAFDIKGVQEDYNLFLRPSTVAASDDGSFYLVSYGANEILNFDVNGKIVNRISGGIGGFNRPFDLVFSNNGNFYVSEYGGNRISIFNRKGKIKKRFGTRGLGDGQLLGPQYLTLDEDDYVYVSDWGNKRISKFDLDGNFIFNFGNGSKNQSAKKLKGPSGLIYFNSKILVADKVQNEIFVYDKNGNFLNSFGKGFLDSPEGISYYDDNKILISESSNLLLYDIENDSFKSIYHGGKSKDLNLKTVKDINGNLLSPDFNNNQLKILSSFSSMYSGMSLKIDRIIANEFPEITVELQVEDSFGNPVIGLNASNFILTENGRKINDPELIFKGFNSKIVDVVFVVEFTEKMKARFPEIKSTLVNLIDSLSPKDNFDIILAGANPIKINTNKNYIKEIDAAFSSINSNNFQFDNSLKLAASELNDNKFNRTVFYIGESTLPSNSFKNIGLVEAKQLLINNGINFTSIFMNKGTNSVELNYLSKETNGKSLYYYRPEGLSGLIDDLRMQKNPYYVFTYKSTLSTDFGRRYLPFEAECFLMSKSGKIDSGYFAPLEF